MCEECFNFLAPHFQQNIDCSRRRESDTLVKKFPRQRSSQLAGVTSRTMLLIAQFGWHSLQEQRKKENLSVTTYRKISGDLPKLEPIYRWRRFKFQEILNKMGQKLSKIEWFYIDHEKFWEILLKLCQISRWDLAIGGSWVQFPVGAKGMIDFFSLAAEYRSPWSALQQHSLCFSCKIGAINPLFTGWFIFMVYKKLLVQKWPCIPVGACNLSTG
jgi:hypothetical protein